jgi:hypothetical protein
MQSKNISDRVSSGFSMVIAVVVIVLPFFVWILLWRKLSFLNQEWAVKRFGSTYASIKND